MVVSVNSGSSSFRCACNKSPTIWGLYLGPLMLGNFHMYADGVRGIVPVA